MATLADVIRRQRKEGKGTGGALASAVGQKTLEKIDPRQFFNQRGLLTALFPSLKTFQAKGIGKEKISGTLETGSATVLKEMVVRLNAIEENTRPLTILPKMSQILTKLLAVSTESALEGKRGKARAEFLKNLKTREEEYESQFETTPTRVVESSDTREKKEPSFLGRILKALAGISVLGLGTLTEGITKLNKTLGPVIKKGFDLTFNLAKSAAMIGLGGMMVKPLTSIARITGRALIGLLSAIAPFMMTPAGLALLGTAGVGWLIYTLYGKDIEDFENKYKQGLDPNDELMKSIPKNDAFNNLPSPTQLKQDTQRRESMRRPQLLGAIAKLESGDIGANAMFGSSKPVEGLSDMTIREAMQFSRSKGDKAIGKYQFKPDTLNDIMTDADHPYSQTHGLTFDDKFSSENQDKLILSRLKHRRGYGDFLSGRLSARDFQKELSKEFAAIPDPDTGVSRYGGSNKAQISNEDMGSLLKSIQKADQPTIMKPEDREKLDFDGIDFRDLGPFRRQMNQQNLLNGTKDLSSLRDSLTGSNQPVVLTDARQTNVTNNGGGGGNNNQIASVRDDTFAQEYFNSVSYSA